MFGQAATNLGQQVRHRPGIDISHEVSAVRGEQIAHLLHLPIVRQAYRQNGATTARRVQVDIQIGRGEGAEKSLSAPERFRVIRRGQQVYVTGVEVGLA